MTNAPPARDTSFLPSEPYQAGDRCTLFLILPSAAGGIVPCLSRDCSEKVVWHLLVRQGPKGYRLPRRDMQWCNEHRPR